MLWGGQVRRAVEVLIQAFDKANIDDDGKLLAGIDPRELYEAGLIVMMRLVFLLSAEERELFLLGDERYDTNYAVFTLRMQLRAESDEILDRRWDAWSRLLATFRAVYGGIEHETLRMPALGGSLCDPDRFPFLEGRAKDSNWKEEAAQPLPISNHTVLLLLEAIQLFEGRTLSYRGLDIEQLGYVYEGLLDHTVKRANKVTLELDATKSAKQPWVTLNELDSAKEKSTEALEELLEERTGSSISRVRNDLSKEVSEEQSERLLTACHNDEALRDQLKLFFHLIRPDSWGYPLVYPEGSYMVTTGEDRRQTGSHYTPVSLTEAIVRETLEPVVYVGPAEGTRREEWRLKSPVELLELKICDPAMGSGAFLVQVCRWLGERVVESWAQAEEAGNYIDVDGEVLDKTNNAEPLPMDLEERAIIARRLIAERCIYGVDLNPLAVELSKLSVWLVSLAKGRPLGFLDHNLKCGDSLLGINRLEQLTEFSVEPVGTRQTRLFGQSLQGAVDKALELRIQLRSMPIRDIRDVENMALLNTRARDELELPGLVADAFIGAVFAAENPNTLEGRINSLTVLADQAVQGDGDFHKTLIESANSDLSKDATDENVRRPFHWPLEFPEVFKSNNGGFDVVVGNPPFLGGQMILGNMGATYAKYIIECFPFPMSGSVDIVVHFFSRAINLLRPSGYLGMLGRRSISEGKNREIGLQQIIQSGCDIYLANTDIVWPGKASVVVHQIHVAKAGWSSIRLLNSHPVEVITSYLSPTELWTAKKLEENQNRIFQGTILLGEGFKIDESLRDEWLADDDRYQDILWPFIGGNEVNRDPQCRAACWIIFFWDWSEERAKSYVLPYQRAQELVKPARDKLNQSTSVGRRRKKYWWKPGEDTKGLYHAVGRGSLFESHPDQWSPHETALRRVLVISTGVTKYPAFTFLANNYIYSNKLCVLADERYSLFALLSSDIHAIWAWKQKTSMGGDLSSLVYAHGNIFETFPFPDALLDDRDHSDLAMLGQSFFDARQRYMVRNDFGLTKFYNVFHDSAKTSTDLQELQELQSNINDAVCNAYGWQGIQPRTGFHEVGYLPEGRNSRFTIDESVREDLLVRISQLNKSRFERSEGRQPTLPTEINEAGESMSAEVSSPQFGLFRDE